MAGLEINCPFCGSKTRIRTSEKQSLLTVKAQLNCPNCGQLKADFVGQICNIKRAVFIDCEDANHWEKPEKELIKEGKIQAKDNAQRLKELQSNQGDLFEPNKPTLPPEKMTPLERVARRARVAQH